MKAAGCNNELLLRHLSVRLLFKDGNFFLLLSRRLTKDTARFKDELDVMKFICKDFWTCVFKKQIDNLRTNHQVTEAG